MLQLEGVKSFSAEAKRAYLYGFWKDVMQERPMVSTQARRGMAIRRQREGTRGEGKDPSGPAEPPDPACVCVPL